MIGWLLKKIAAAPAQSADPQAVVAPERCALWHDVSRALDAKPKSTAK
jgi:hypothetical protein